MDRRDFIKLAGWAGLSVVSPWGMRRAGAEDIVTESGYGGPFWISIHADGGWDPTVLCDPKGRASEAATNPVNNYFTSEIVEVGAFKVPPIEGHVDFFTRFQDQLLVLNGIDVQTNSHMVGERHIWSGSTDMESPAFTALIAGETPDRPPLPFVSNGGYSETGGVVAQTRITDVNAIAELAYPQRINGNDADSSIFSTDGWDRINAARLARLDRQRTETRLPRVRRAMDVLYTARGQDNELARFTEHLPETMDNSNNRLKRQAQVALAAFKAGISVSANLSTGGFDTHGDHDNRHIPRMQQIVEGVTFIMDQAEEMGIADQVVVMCGSDFGRTPYYNANMGKDHWSITSMMMMGPGIPGGRVIGATTETQRPKKIDPVTLAVSEADDAVKLHPGNIHAALRELGGVENSPGAINNVVLEALPLFTT